MHTNLLRIIDEADRLADHIERRTHGQGPQGHIAMLGIRELIRQVRTQLNMAASSLGASLPLLSTANDRLDDAWADLGNTLRDGV